MTDTLSQDDVDPAEGGESATREYSAVLALVSAGILVVGVLGVSVGLLIILARSGEDRGPEAALSLVFVAAAVVLILVVCTLSIVFVRLGVFDPDEAMGLPRGSVRAVIALLLIMLFFISAVFLFNSTKNGDSEDSRTLAGISQDRFNEIATEDIQSVVQRDDEGETVYDVTRTANTTTSDDIAKQLVTTVATLVTAVAAFYFGANSVSTAIAGSGGGGAGATGRSRRGADGPRDDTGGRRAEDDAHAGSSTSARGTREQSAAAPGRKATGTQGRRTRTESGGKATPAK